MIKDNCNGCGYCINVFECPALRFKENEKLVEIDQKICIDCGTCIYACNRKAIVEAL